MKQGRVISVMDCWYRVAHQVRWIIMAGFGHGVLELIKFCISYMLGVLDNIKSFLDMFACCFFLCLGSYCRRWNDSGPSAKSKVSLNSRLADLTCVN